MAFARFSPWKSRAALRPPPPPLPFPDDGGRLPSFGTKLFMLAQASIRVPSTEKCSLDNSELQLWQVQHRGHELARNIAVE